MNSYRQCLIILVEKFNFYEAFSIIRALWLASWFWLRVHVKNIYIQRPSSAKATGKNKTQPVVLTFVLQSFCNILLSFFRSSCSVLACSDKKLLFFDLLSPPRPNPPIIVFLTDLGVFTAFSSFFLSLTSCLLGGSSLNGFPASCSWISSIEVKL